MTDFSDLLPPASSGMQDDSVLPFQLVRISVHGRVARLGSCIDQILKQHDYPERVSILLGEALTLTALLGAALKFEGKLILQTKSNGPVDMIVAQYEAPGHLRGYARFDQDKMRKIEDQETPQGELLGHGHLVMTIDQGTDMQRYQGIVALEGHNLSEAADAYFKQSEQLPSKVKLAVARQYIGGPQPGDHWHWRAGGLMIQDLTTEGGKPYHISDQNIVIPDALQSDEDGWNRAWHLASTLEDHELLDPLLPAENLLYRLFHEEGVRIFPVKSLDGQCRCSRNRVLDVMKSFPHDDLVNMIKENTDFIEVVCEFCSQTYEFKLDEIKAL